MNYKYDVAISFAEEDRNIALALSQSFEKIGLKAFYYTQEELLGWGNDLQRHLEQIYFVDAQYVVVLFSENYLREDKINTKLELAIIQSRMMDKSDIVYMLPVRVDEKLALTDYPDLENLIYYSWKHTPDVIAFELKRLLGKELLAIDENTKPDSIIYNFGKDSFVIAESDSPEINRAIIFSNGPNPIIISKKDNEQVTIQQFNFSKPKDTKYPCPHCAKELDDSKYGINTCSNCGKYFYVENKSIEVKIYKTIIDKNEVRLYNKIRARIENKIIDRDYEGAYEYCLKAEDIGPAEVATWEHFAITEFLLEIYKEKSIRKSSFEILKSIKCHIERCKLHGISDDDYDGLVIKIANRLFEIEKGRIQSLRAQFRDELGYEKWSSRNIQYLLSLLNSFELCYKLYPDTLYLEEYVNELSKPNKWIEKSLENDSLINTEACRGLFNAVQKLIYLVNKIRKTKTEYEFPLIVSQKFVIKSVEDSNSNYQ
jgi:transcription elongation factor Elf1